MGRRSNIFLVLSVCIILFGCQEDALTENKTDSSEKPNSPLTIVPPLLTVTINDEIISTTQGAYCWSEEHSKKHSITECVDTEDPLLIEKAKEGEAPSFDPRSTVTISYSEEDEPEIIKVVFQTTENDHVVEVVLDGQEFELPNESGLYYYGTFASWESGGDTSHAFRVSVE